jgi:hypothetical protein
MAMTSGRALGLGLVVIGAALVVLAAPPFSFVGFVLVAAGIAPAAFGGPL